MPLGAFRINTLAKTSAVVAGPFTEAIRTPIGLRAGGGANISTTESKFGGSSAYFDASGDSINCSKPLLPATGDFTIEYWLNQTTLSANRDHWQQYASGVTGRATGYTSQTTGIVVFFVNPDVSITSTDTISAGVWHHIVMQRNGTTFELFLDGVSQGTATSSGSVYQGGNFIIGLGPWSDAYGYMDEFRISNIARYSGGFTPSTTAFTHDQYTELLLHADGTNDLTTFVDDTGDRARLGVNADGATDIDTTTGPITSTSIRLGANGDIIKPSRTDLGDILNDGDYTIEAFVRHDAVTSVDYIFSNRKTTFGVFGWVLSLRGDVAGDPFQLLTSGYTGITGSTSIDHQNGASANTWYHVAVVRSGNIITLYVDGVASTTTIDLSGSSYAPSGQLWFGSNGNTTTQMLGYMDEIRVSNVARYTTGFSVPTERFTSDANTLLLIHGQGTDGSQLLLDDNSSARTPISGFTNSTTAISTGQSKFGGSSLFSNTSTGYFQSQQNPYDWDTGDFTVEFFFYNTGQLDQFRLLFDQRDTAGGVAITLVIRNTDDDLYLFTENAERITGDPVTANTWHHVAVTMNSGTLTLWQNGVSKGTYTPSNSDFSITNGFRLSSNRLTGTSYYIGYYDELRISSVARYTTGFTPTTTAFKNDSNTLALFHFDGTDTQTDILDDNSAFFQ